MIDASASLLIMRNSPAPLSEHEEAAPTIEQVDARLKEDAESDATIDDVDASECPARVEDETQRRLPRTARPAASDPRCQPSGSVMKMMTLSYPRQPG
jgi:hypothetical protein